MDNFEDYQPDIFIDPAAEDVPGPVYDGDHVDPAFLPTFDNELTPGDSAYAQYEAAPPSYTAADKEQVLSIIDQEEARRRSEFGVPAAEREMNQIPFRLQLRNSGPVAAAAILDAANNEIDRFRAMNYLELCAGPENASAILTLMDKQRQRHEGCEPLCNTLQRTIDVPCIPELYAYVGDTTDPSEDERRLHDALIIALSAAQRELDPGRRQQWIDVVDDLAASDRPDGTPFLQPGMLESLQKATTPGKIALQYARLFYAETPDTSMNYQPHDGQSTDDLGRLNTARNLHAIAEERGAVQRGDTIAPFILSRLTRLERMPSPYSVPVGVELEVTESSLMGPAEGSLHDITARIETKMADIVRVIGAGVPERDEDAGEMFIEFATDATYQYETIGREVQHMLALNVVGEHQRTPLHMTIGNITTQGPKGRVSYIIARCLEATGWSCDGERLRQGLVGINTWALRGAAGLHEREADSIQLGSTAAVEQRTLIFKDQDGFIRTLRSGTLLGAAGAAYQYEGDRDAVRTGLAQIWETFDAAACALFQEYGMASPSDSDTWIATELDYDDSSRKIEPHLCQNFRQLANLLDEAETNPDSDGAHFQDAVQRLIISHRSQVAALLSSKS
jgi:hypothetical protein